jgi:hypothetical protein
MAEEDVNSLVLMQLSSPIRRYCYSFDRGFDGLDAVTRLSTATDPYAP